MKKTSKILTCTLVLLTVFISSFSIGFESKAYGETDSMDFYVNYSEPTTGEYNGYFSVAYLVNGKYRLYTYFWTFNCKNNSSTSATGSQHFMTVNINADRIVFQCNVGDNVGTYIILSCYDWQDNIHILHKEYATSGNQSYEMFRHDYTGTPIVGYCFSGNCMISSSNTFNDAPVPAIHWNESVDASQLNEQLNLVIEKLANIDGDASNIMVQIESIWNQNNSIHQRLWNIEQLLNDMKQTDADKQAVEEFDSSSTAQSDKINELNKQNTTEKVDVNSASNEVDKHIDTVAIGNYGAVLSVFTGNTHILQYLLIVLVIALISYVLFGKR